MLHLNDRCFYSCLWITPDLRCQKRLWILCFSSTSIKIWRSCAFFAFSPLHLSEPLRKQKVVVCDLWLVDFDPFCVSLCFKVSCFVFEKRRKFYLSSKIFLTSLHWNMASLDSKGEIVPRELPNPEEKQLRMVENEPLRSRELLHLLTNAVDATVTVWLTSQKNLNLEHAQHELLRMLAEVPSSSRLI